MRRELFKNIFVAALIVLAFFIGLYYPKSIDNYHPLPVVSPLEVENRIIHTCLKDNYFEILDKQFYCFSAE